MTAIAKEKMPQAVLLCHDFSKGIPEEISGLKFDYIISTYALHHVTDTAKAGIITLKGSQKLSLSKQVLG